MTNPEYIRELDNGLRLVHRHMPDTDSVTLQIFFGAGGRYEDMQREYGVSHFLEHLLFQGSKKYPSAKILSETVDGVGGYMNAYTTAELTSYYAKIPSEKFNDIADLLADLTMHPLFDPTQIDRERGVIIEEMNVYRDDPGQYIFDLIGDVLWPQDVLRSNILGTEETIRSLPREIITGYHASQYIPSNAVMAIAGNVTLAEAEDVIAPLFQAPHMAAPRPFAPAYGPLATEKVRIFHQNTSQTHLVLAGRGLPLRHHNEAAFRVLGALMGGGPSSRLYHTIREEKGLAYVVYMGMTGYADTGKWEVYAGVSNDKVEEAVEAIVQELELIRTRVASVEELSRVKQQLRGRIIMSQETNGAVADRLGAELLLTGEVRSVDDMLQSIEAVQADEIMALAQKYLDPNSMRMALIGPHDNAPQLAKIIS
ncbi:insulinase family protein [bacterium]|nr:MAG: insulinase family protein [bacterium]